MVRSIGWENPELTFKDLVQVLESNNFILTDKKHDIHSVDSIKFMSDIIGAEGWVLDILKSGVKIDFNQRLPTTYQEPNNQSAVKEMEFLRNKVQSWIDNGFVQLKDTKPLYVNPMSVVVKQDLLSNKIKKHPVIEMSHCINKKLVKKSFNMDNFISEPSIRKEDFQIIFDLENMYFHFKLAPEHRPYFSFSLPDQNDGHSFYEFKVMCYGYSLTAYIVTRVIVPIKHKLGIRFHIYIDDGRILGQSKSECHFKVKFAVHIFQL